MTIVDELLRPEAYPAPRPQAVTLATTHASWVFLADGEVWKVRRPVDYGFLDYSDAGKRRRCAEEEVRLGRRLAPGVYLGVEPVYLGPGGHAFVGPGEVVDAAVRMRRLPDEQSAQALVRAGRFGPEHVRRLCDRLAAFYAAVPRADDFGAPELLAAQIDENHRQTLPYAGRFVARELLERLHAAQARLLAGAAPLLRRRAREGRVREGHGDLRLEHVYFVPGGDGAAPASPSGIGVPIVIDPIEFNTGFRSQDAALDVAFLAMELEAEGRRDLAAYLLACFARASGDYGFYPVVDLYLGHRAWVRAKVACFVAGDAGTPPDKARRKAVEAERLFALADAYARAAARPPPGTLLAVGGMIGSGKSTIAEALGLALGAPVISSDGTRKALAGLAATERGDAALYDERVTAQTYGELLRAAEQVLASGRHAILDATFREARFRGDARELARRHGCRFLFLHVDADDDTLRARLRARAGTASASDAREDLLPSFRRSYEPPTELAPADLLPIDGCAPTDTIVTAVRERLAR